MLIKLVVQAIHFYFMSILFFPISFSKDLSALISSFWWRKWKNSWGIHWRPWATISKHKVDRDLGFRDLELMNRATLAKQTWGLLSSQDSAWAKIVKGIYFPKCLFWDMPRNRHGSWFWRSLIVGRDVLKDHCTWSVWNGLSINTWSDQWVPDFNSL